MDPENLPEAGKDTMNFSSDGKIEAKAWRDIWGAGQGVGSMDDIPAVRDLVMRMEQEYRDASQRLCVA
jgi:nitronate monooxygenase